MEEPAPKKRGRPVGSRKRVLVSREELREIAASPDAPPQLPALYLAVSANPFDINLQQEEMIHLTLRANVAAKVNFLNDYLVRVATAADVKRLPRPEELPDPETVASLKGLSKRMKEYLLTASVVSKLEKQIIDHGKDLLTIRRARGIPIGATNDTKQVDGEVVEEKPKGFMFKRSSPEFKAESA